MASKAAGLVLPKNDAEAGHHEEALNMSATRSSIGLTTIVYCFGVLSPPYVLIVPAGPDHSALTPVEGTLPGLG